MLVGLALAGACVDVLGPDPVVSPTLERLDIDDFRSSLRDGGVLWIAGYAVDKAFRLQRGQRVPITIVTSSGDREAVGLFHFICPMRDRPPRFPCFTFSITMQEGHHVAALGEHVAAIGGRFELISESGRFASVVVFDPEQLLRHANAAQSWPGVALVDLMLPFCLEPGPGCLREFWRLAAPVAVDMGRAIEHDGIVQMRSGDTVTVYYKQPGGLTIQVARIVP